MEMDEKDIAERLEAATTLLEKTLSWLEERQGALSGEVERISATVEQSRREAELAEKLAAVEQELAELKQRLRTNVLQSAAQDAAGGHSRDAGQARHRRRPGGCADTGCGAGGLSLEQRIAVKTNCCAREQSRKSEISFSGQ